MNKGVIKTEIKGVNKGVINTEVEVVDVTKNVVGAHHLDLKTDETHDTTHAIEIHKATTVGVMTVNDRPILATTASVHPMLATTAKDHPMLATSARDRRIGAENLRIHVTNANTTVADETTLRREIEIKEEEKMEGERHTTHLNLTPIAKYHLEESRPENGK